MPADRARAPGWHRLVLELRAPLEFGASLLAAPWLLAAPRGDGHPVLVFPGFLATNMSTRPMRRLLDWLGHDVHGWNQGRNLRPSAEVIAGALGQIHALHGRSGRRVSLVGWSLGGLYARELAKRAPDAVRSVVTLGSPFSGPLEATRASRLFDRLNRGRPLEPLARESIATPPPLPTSSIYSRSDAIVAWQLSIEHAGPISESIQVPASHMGLGVNPWALYALADRLAQPEGGWQPFAQGERGRPWFPRDAHRRAAPR